MDILLNLDGTTKLIAAGILMIAVVLILIIRSRQTRQGGRRAARCPYGDHEWEDVALGRRCRKCGVVCLDGRHTGMEIVDSNGVWRAYCSICGKELRPRARTRTQH